MKKISNEKELQLFISKNPWLININYENVPDLKNNGIEYQAGDQKRIDLILKDKISSRPVIVEFKISTFYRENIGQILEYKARIISLLNNEENELSKLFKSYISVPILVLIVKECDDFSRIACNMAGIKIYEYKNFSKQINTPKKLKTIENLSASYRKSIIPITFNRGDEIENLIYRKIKKILEKYNLLNKWMEPRGNQSYYLPHYCNIFINRWMFSDEIVSIGLFEDIVNDNKVVISYFCTDKNKMKDFVEKYNLYNHSKISWEWNESNEGIMDIKYDLKYFKENVTTIFEKELKTYLKIISEIK